MIADEAGLIWHRFAAGYGPKGGDFVEWQCEQHPRLSRMVQRATGDSPPVETYHVDGLAKHFKTPHQALEALRANP